MGNGICACANDLTENGVMTEVVNIARQLKHFGGQSRSGRQRYRQGSRCQSSRCASCGRGCTSCSHCRNAQSFRYDDTRCDVNVYGRGRRPCNRNYYVGKRSADTDDEVENTNALIDNYLANSTEETAEKIVSSAASWKAGTLVGPKFDKWVPYAAMLTYSLPDEKGIRDFAHFIYCMLNHQ